jgi:septal ring factor EnvC (AmiA/AmiB activator)
MIATMADHGNEHPAVPTPDEALNAAYTARTNQLYEARGALAEAVAELTKELQHRRAEAAELNKQLEARSKQVARLERDLQATSREIEALRNMKVVRWTAWPRAAVYRWRARRQ